MLRLSWKMMFAIEAVVYIAYHAADTLVRSKNIATRQDILWRYLEQVLQQLVREGVLRGVRGPRGGYRLARELRRVTLGTDNAYRGGYGRHRRSCQKLREFANGSRGVTPYLAGIAG
jgi:hypothetical protein